MTAPTVILGTGSNAPLPTKTETIGQAAQLLAEEHHIHGTNFTLKIDGTPTPPDTPTKTIKPTSTLELIEHTPTPTPDPTPTIPTDTPTN